MNTVVLFIDDNGCLGGTYECCTEDDQRLAYNLICNDLSIEPEDKDFEHLLACCELFISRDCGECGSSWESGRILIGGLESVS